MNVLQIAQITGVITIVVLGSGLLLYTDIYEDVQHGIVEVLCLSCIKLEPATIVEFAFDTATGEPHVDFVLENLSNGVVFLHYSEDACAACDIMEPVIKDLFNVDFPKQGHAWNTVTYHGETLTHIYINIDHSPEYLADSFPIYDKDQIAGLPTFSVVTLGYDRGIIKPSYTSVYGTLALDTNEERQQFFAELVHEAQQMYTENKPGYDPD